MEQQPTSSSLSSIWNTSPPAEAVQLALLQQKLFLVWISPAPSNPAWEVIWTNASIQSLLAEHTVSITLSQGSTEAAMFLQLLSSAPTETGVWIVFAGHLLDSFAEPPTSPEDMLQRINSTISKSEDLKLRNYSTNNPPPTHSVEPATSSPLPPEVQAQLAARRAKLEAAKLQYGTPPLKSKPMRMYRQRGERTIEISGSKTS